jgi:hypothetical protein
MNEHRLAQVVHNVSYLERTRQKQPHVLQPFCCLHSGTPSDLLIIVQMQAVVIKQASLLKLVVGVTNRVNVLHVHKTDLCTGIISDRLHTVTIE